MQAAARAAAPAAASLHGWAGHGDGPTSMGADSRPAYGRLRTLSWQLRSTVAASGATAPPPPAPGHTSSYEHPVVGEAAGGRHLPVLIANGAADGPRFRRGQCCHSRRSSAVVRTESLNKSKWMIHKM
jgi:hypothetical protein